MRRGVTSRFMEVKSMPCLMKGTILTQRMVLIGLSCALGLVLGGLGVVLGSKKERNLVPEAPRRLMRKVAILSKDASAPPQTETATFALG